MVDARVLRHPEYDRTKLIIWRILFLSHSLKTVYFTQISPARLANVSEAMTYTGSLGSPSTDDFCLTHISGI